MNAPSSRTVSSLLRAIQEGDEQAGTDLFALLYDELYSRAARLSRGQPKHYTLQATALVHEAYLRLVQQPAHDFQDRDHFLACASVAMRHALVDHAKRRKRLKRSAPGRATSLDVVVAAYEEHAIDVEKLDLALRKLAEFNPIMVKAIELRFFGGASVEEAARILHLPKRTFERHFQAARAWLRKYMS